MIISDKEKLQILTFKELELLDCDMFAWKILGWLTIAALVQIVVKLQWAALEFCLDPFIFEIFCVVIVSFVLFLPKEWM